MIRRVYILACLALILVAGCGGGGGGGGESPRTLVTIVGQCVLEGQPVSCTSPPSLTVTTITPVVTVTFTEPMNRAAVQQFVQVTIENLTDGIAISQTIDGLVANQSIAIEWNSASTQLTVRVLAVARQLEDGKSYRVTAFVSGAGCVQTAAGAPICTGTLGPFTFRVDV